MEAVDKATQRNSEPVAQERRDPYRYARLLADTETLSSEWFGRPAIEVAKDLIGCVLLHNQVGGTIVETEAYLGSDDLAAHAARGKTDRTKVLFGPPGRAYVYFIYGIHECLNVVADLDGVPGCVLIRALEPLCGLSVMYERRRWRGPVTGLANGPGKLTQALAITREQYGARLDRGPLTIRSWRKQAEFEIKATPRIGITKCVDWPLRFVCARHPCVSNSRRNV